MSIVNEILRINEKIQRGQGLKILTPNQMFSRLPISLAQLKAGKNSGKLKKLNQTAIVFLAQIKKLTKNIYKR